MSADLKERDLMLPTQPARVPDGDETSRNLRTHPVAGTYVAASDHRHGTDGPRLGLGLGSGLGLASDHRYGTDWPTDRKHPGGSKAQAVVRLGLGLGVRG